MTAKNRLRDIAIFKDYENNVPAKKLSEFYLIGVQRIYQLIRKAKRAKRYVEDPTSRIHPSYVEFINSYNAMKTMHINLYTKSNCPNCIAAKQLLDVRGIEYVEIDVELGKRWENLLREFPDARQMPQIFINDQRVGGLAGLQAALQKISV
jgi:glutaredoxin 3